MHSTRLKETSRSELGFGIMRFQNRDGDIDYNCVKESLDEYMRGDFCYFDLHPDYVKGMAQTILRKYVVDRYPRSSYIVANKMPYYGINKQEHYEQIFRGELSECGLEYFDRYMLHAITKDVYDMHLRFGGFEFLKKEKEEGRIKEIGFSYHDTPELLEEILSSHPEMEFVQLQINYLDWDSEVIQARKCYETARKFDIEIIVMEPIKGGSLSVEDGGYTHLNIWRLKHLNLLLPLMEYPSS